MLARTGFWSMYRATVTKYGSSVDELGEEAAFEDVSDEAVPAVDS